MRSIAHRDNSLTIYTNRGDGGLPGAYAQWLRHLDTQAGELLDRAKRATGGDRAVAEARARVFLGDLEKRMQTARRLQSRFGAEVREVRGAGPAAPAPPAKPVTSRVSGYASVFYRAGDAATEFELAPGLVERIDPAAFTRAIKDRHDVRALVDHNPSLVVGRTAAGTLRLSVDQRGLRYVADLPKDVQGDRVRSAVGRRDVSGSSFGFITLQQRFVRGSKYDVRVIEDLELLDVSPVTYPAYRGTSAEIT